MASGRVVPPSVERETGVRKGTRLFVLSDGRILEGA